jgi:copper chaperone
MTTHELQVQGMSCQHCVKSVREALLRVPGVARVDVEVGRAKVETSDEVSRSALVSALAAIDYPAS